METQTLSPRIDSSLTNLKTPVQKNHATELPNPTPAEPVQSLDLSDNALKLSETFQTRTAPDDIRSQAISGPEQARQIAERIGLSAKQFPAEILAAQSNLTSNVVKGLLG